MREAYYNEIDPYAAQWLRNLIKAGHIADGEVDTRSIVDVSPDDLRGFTQCHFFAGIGGWSHALRLAGWSDDRPIWTGSCPCQPFSVAGKGAGTDDPRHLWPHFHRLITAVRPPVVMGEQVAGAAGYGWLDGVRADLEGKGYASRGVDIPACAMDAPHIRQRLYWVACDMADAPLIKRNGRGCGDDLGERRGVQEQTRASDSHMADAPDNGPSFGPHSDARRTEDERRRDNDLWGEHLRSGSSVRDMADADGSRSKAWVSAQSGRHERLAEITDNRSNRRSGSWGEYNWLEGADGKARRVEPSIRLLAHGVSGRVGRLRAYGNAIVPPLAAEVIKAFMMGDDRWM